MARQARIGAPLKENVCERLREMTNTTLVVRMIWNYLKQSPLQVMSSMPQRFTLMILETAVVTAPPSQSGRDETLAGHRTTIVSFPVNDGLQKRYRVLESHRSRSTPPGPSGRAG